MLGRGQIVKWEGVHLYVDAVGIDQSKGSVFLCLRYPITIGASILEFSMIPPVIVEAHEVKLIGNNYQPKTKAR